MTTQVTATVVGGTLKLDEALKFPEQTRVRLTVEPIAGAPPTTAPQETAPQEAWQAIMERLKERPLHFGDRRYTRDEIHERR